MARTEYENKIADLLLRTGAFVQQEPLIEGKTPDILAKSVSKSDCLIECTTLARSNTCQHGKHIYGLDDPNRLNERLYYKIEDKLKVYPKQIIGDHSLVVAVQNECCALYDSSVMEVAFGAWRYQAGRWTNLWAGTPDADGLFGKYPHCSGILHSTWIFHLFIPNPDTATPVDPTLFQFADIAEPKFFSNGSVSASTSVQPPKEALVRKIRNATVKGLPAGAILLEGDFEIIGEVDGIPEVQMHAKIPFNAEEKTIFAKPVGSQRKQG